MALIDCRECGHRISDKATTCPNCGAPVELSLDKNEQTVLANTPSTPPPPIMEQKDNTEEKKSSGALIFVIGLILIIITVFIGLIAGGSSSSSRSSYVADSLYRVEQERIERERAKWQDADSIRKYINGTVWTFTQVLEDGVGQWYKLEFKKNKVYCYEVKPSDGKWGRPKVCAYKIEEKHYVDTGGKYTCISWWLPGAYLRREQILNITSLTNPENINTENTPRAEMQFYYNPIIGKDIDGIKVVNKDINPWE